MKKKEGKTRILGKKQLLKSLFYTMIVRDILRKKA